MTRIDELWRLPPVLVVQLKRFQFDRTARRKLTNKIDFPVSGLDLSDYIAPSRKDPNYVSPSKKNAVVEVEEGEGEGEGEGEREREGDQCPAAAMVGEGGQKRQERPLRQLACLRALLSPMQTLNWVVLCMISMPPYTT